MIKKIIPSLLILLGFLGASVAKAECRISYSTASSEVEKVLSKDGFSFSRYNEICTKLQRNNARLVFAGDATVLANKSIAWAYAMVGDKQSGMALTSWGSAQTYTNDYASQDTAMHELYLAVNDAINHITIDKALAELNHIRQNQK